MILHSNKYPDSYGKYEFLAAFGAFRKLAANQHSFRQLQQMKAERESWLFGHFSYELKDELEDLHSHHSKKFGFPILQFFEPMHLLVWKRGESIATWYSHQEEELKKYVEKPNSLVQELDFQFPKFTASFTKEDYLRRVNALKEEIRYGNIYEVNFCQNFTAKGPMHPQLACAFLNEQSPMPFSSFYKSHTDYLIGASPERFMAKRGQKLICQPIKGTAKRSTNQEEDEAIKKHLQNDLKEQTENVMIVDLMRNDLSKTAARNSVQVEELFGVYTFPQVHQLISTVTAELDSESTSLEAIQNAFPMGSMTGAPKIKAMQLIEEWEGTRRELYSGSVGYFDDEGDFDFNVVIRSLLYNEETKFTSLTVGGAITDMAVAENEYEECLLKAKAIFDLSELNQ